MPWTVSDVDKHKKGLSDEGKARWVATANSTLADCIKKGGTDETCAPQAIRIANGITGHEETYAVFNIQQCGYTVKRKAHQGKDHLIVPVVMMVEGVHNGSLGPLYQSINELGKIPESWNGIPIVIDHPESGGMYVSANDPDIIDERIVGRVYNTCVKDNKKLVAEAWLDEEKLRLLSKEILDSIERRDPLEVSLGMFSEEDFIPGDWNGEHYEAIARNHRPDHLALLPGGVGACSLEDGCGLGVNNSSSINLKLEEVKKMADITACTPCVKKKVDELIANSQGKYTEDDRVVLETLSESILDKMAKPIEVEKEVIKEVEKTIEVNVLSEEDRAILDEAKKLKKEKREANIKLIQTNSKEWTVEELNAMNDGVLTKIAGMASKEETVDYTVFGGKIIQTNESEEEPLLPTGLKFKTK